MKTKKKYFFIIGIIIPLILPLIGGKNNIILMVISLCILGVIIPIIFITEGINPNASILLSNSRFKKKKKQRWLSISDYLFRLLLIFIGIICIWYFSIPIYQDTYLLTIRNETESGQYLVTHTSSPISFLSLIMQTIRFEHSGDENYHYYLSPHNRIRKNNSYNFIIFKNSKIILSAKLIE